MSKYDVHIYAVCRVKVPGVEADSQVEACRKAENQADLNHAIRAGQAEYVEEVHSFLADELDGDGNRVAEHALTVGEVDGRVKMYALVSNQGTAAAETALCEKCYLEAANRSYSQELASRCDDIPDLHTFHDCSGNDALHCCICGQSIHGEKEQEEE